MIARDFPEHRVAVLLNQLKPSVTSAPDCNIGTTQQKNEEEGDKVSHFVCTIQTRVISVL